MAIRIDEYGHIIRDDTSAPVNTTNPSHNSDADQLYVPDEASSLGYLSGTQAVSNSFTPILETSMPWYGSAGAFWAITMILSLGVALVMSMAVAPLIFETSESSSDFLESITHFLFNIAPYAIFIGAIVGGVWYNSKGTRKSGRCYHAAYEYILSPLCAIAGAVGTGLIIFLLSLAVYVMAAILAICIAIAVISGLVSGG